MKQGRNLFVHATAAEAKAGQPYTSQAMLDVIDERRRQLLGEGFAPEKDDEYRTGELTRAALSYSTRAAVWLKMRGSGHDEVDIERMASAAAVPSTWPWSRRWWKPHGLRRCLVIAAALLLAEIERLDRAEAERLRLAAGKALDACFEDGEPRP